MSANISSEPNVTFGVELEFIFALPKTHLSRNGRSNAEQLFEKATEMLNSQPALLDKVNNKYANGNHLNYSQWNLVKDSSIMTHPREVAQLFSTTTTGRSDFAASGMELVSPVCRFQETSIWLPQFSQITTALAGAAYNNSSTGLHVHLGLEEGELTLSALKILVMVWAASQQVIESLHPKHRHGNVNIWCASLTSQVPGQNRNEILTNLVVALGQLTPTLKELQAFATGGVKKINVSEATAQKSITLEFREHAGTLKAVEIQEWVGFCRKMLLFAIRASAETRLSSEFVLQIFNDTTTLKGLFELIGLEQESQRYFLRRRQEIARLDEETGPLEEKEENDYGPIVIA